MALEFTHKSDLGLEGSSRYKFRHYGARTITWTKPSSISPTSYWSDLTSYIQIGSKTYYESGTYDISGSVYIWFSGYSKKSGENYLYLYVNSEQKTYTRMTDVGTKRLSYSISSLLTNASNTLTTVMSCTTNVAHSYFSLNK